MGSSRCLNRPPSGSSPLRRAMLVGGLLVSGTLLLFSVGTESLGLVPPTPTDAPPLRYSAPTPRAAQTAPPTRAGNARSPKATPPAANLIPSPSGTTSSTPFIQTEPQAVPETPAIPTSSGVLGAPGRQLTPTSPLESPTGGMLAPTPPAADGEPLDARPRATPSPSSEPSAGPAALPTASPTPTPEPSPTAALQPPQATGYPAPPPSPPTVESYPGPG